MYLIVLIVVLGSSVCHGIIVVKSVKVKINWSLKHGILNQPREPFITILPEKLHIYFENDFFFFLHFLPDAHFSLFNIYYIMIATSVSFQILGKFLFATDFFFWLGDGWLSLSPCISHQKVRNNARHRISIGQNVQCMQFLCEWFSGAIFFFSFFLIGKSCQCLIKKGCDVSRRQAEANVYLSNP